MKLRVLTETARAVATGVTNLALGRGGHSLLTLRAGDPAPDFRLSASDGRDYTLSEFLGRKYVVIAWFPKAFTGGCTVECRSLGVHRALINRTSVQFFAASVDAVATNAEFAVALDLAYPHTERSVAGCRAGVRCTGCERFRVTLDVLYWSRWPHSRH